MCCSFLWLDLSSDPHTHTHPLTHLHCYSTENNKLLYLHPPETPFLTTPFNQNLNFILTPKPTLVKNWISALMSSYTPTHGHVSALFCVLFFFSNGTWVMHFSYGEQILTPTHALMGWLCSSRISPQCMPDLWCVCDDVCVHLLRGSRGPSTVTLMARW